MRLLAVLVLAVLTSGGLLVEYEAAMLLRDLRITVRELDYPIGNLNDATKGAAETVSLANVALGDVRDAAKAETKTADKIFLETDKTMASIRLLVVRLDHDVVPQAASLLEKANRGVDFANVDLVGLQSAIAETNKLIADADLQVTDPNIKKTLDELAKSGEEALESMVELRAILTDGRQVADAVREAYLKPVNVWIKTIEKLLGIAPPIVTAIGAVK